MQRLQLPPLSLYVHIPWCVRKCPYCDFNSHAFQKSFPEADYVAALLRDLDADLHWAQGRELESIFFGGGTPSLFSAQAIETIMRGISQRLCLADNAEITLEANPGTAEQSRFREYRLAGINRLSIGVQSFQDRQLQLIGRIHGADEARCAVDMAISCGFNNFNIDLMHGLPEQTAGSALSDLETAISLGAPHISWYQMTLEPNTVFYSSPPPFPGEEVLESINETGHQYLQRCEYMRYEVSAFAQNGFESRHNRNYWEFGDYLGIGAGAHGKITLPDKGRILRTSKTRQPDNYLERGKDFYASVTDIDDSELALEFFMNALRLRDGVPAKLFEERTGLALARVERSLQKLQARGLLDTEIAGSLKTTSMGFQFLNSVLEAF